MHARRRICNAVNIDHFADITSQDDGALLAASRFEEHSPQFLLCMALASLSKLYGWEETKTRQKGESREQQLERNLRYRREHCTALMDSVDEIMMALAEKYAVERNGRWYLAREGARSARLLSSGSTTEMNCATSCMIFASVLITTR